LKKPVFAKKVSFFSIHSVRMVITLLFVLWVLLISFVFSYGSSRTLYMEQQKTLNSNRRLLTLYMEQMNLNLNLLEKYLRAVVPENENLLSINSSAANPSDTLLSIIRFSRDITSGLQQYSWLHSVYLFDQERVLTEMVISGNITYSLRQELAKMIGGSSSESLLSRWRIACLDGRYYVVFTLPAEGRILCAIASVHSLISAIQMIDASFLNTFFLRVNDDPFLYASTGHRVPDDLQAQLAGLMEKPASDVIPIVLSSSLLNMDAVVVYEPTPEFPLGVSPGLIYLFLFVAFSCVLLYLLLNRLLLKPLVHLQMVSNEILLGHHDARLNLDTSFSEFSVTYRSINKMLNHIQSLRINVYEEQLEKQHMEIEKLQQQIKPHFLLNSFNLIHGMARDENYHAIEDLSMCLSRYFRYLISNSGDHVPLSDEMECVSNYLNIQKCRYMNEVEFSVSMDESLRDALVIPLMIQTFAENAIIHALRTNDKLVITIRAYPIRYGNESSLCIDISDNGCGYPQEILDLFKRDDSMLPAGIGIGIRNVRRRLQLLYGAQARVMLSNKNNSGGAQTTILTPLIYLHDVSKEERS